MFIHDIWMVIQKRLRGQDTERVSQVGEADRVEAAERGPDVDRPTA